ncbi:GNAT family N-acetyltransferase [Lachnospiraceae bacterium MD335]|jgi:GNAT superfamily N-acetyltransferase|nr:hypothetical protein C809_01716 [Lachnospiraceae bacterium MD335]NDO49303.1 GNAT family N-acetyltransferase [Lachnospiraceae bacterium MD335]
MEYKENVLTYEDYFNLRESVGWMNFSKEQTQKALLNSIYTVIAVDDYGDAVGVGRLTGDGMYYMIVDIAVCPDYQKKGIGTEIINMLITYVSRETPVGGRSSIQLIAEKGKESFYEKIGFKKIPHECCGFGMRKVIRK